METYELTKLIVIDVLTVIAFITPCLVAILLAIKGIKCILRSEMLRIYYHNRDKETIRQYELENFIELYNAYKALKGNSFIDKIYKEVMSWDVTT